MMMHSPDKKNRQRAARQALALAVIGSGVCLLGWKRQGASVDQSSPAATVRAFVTAFQARNGDAMAACIKGAQPSAGIKTMINSVDGPAGWVKTVVVNSLIVEGDANRASVAVELALQPTKGQNSGARGSAPITFNLGEIFHLERGGDRWFIVPDADIEKQLAQPAPASPEKGRYFLRPLAATAALAGLSDSGTKAVEQARLASATTTCLSNQKQIGIAVNMYMQDFDEMYPRKNASYKDQVYPYVKNLDVFRCPLDAKGTVSYTLNANVQGTGLAAMMYPAQTVLLYEGKNMQMAFRHDGKAAVCFADGHAKLITPIEAKSVYWYPGGKTPDPFGKGGSLSKGGAKPKK